MQRTAQTKAAQARVAVMTDRGEWRQFALLAVALLLEFTTMVAG